MKAPTFNLEYCLITGRRLLMNCICDKLMFYFRIKHNDVPTRGSFIFTSGSNLSPKSSLGDIKSFH